MQCCKICSNNAHHFILISPNIHYFNSIPVLFTLVSVLLLQNPHIYHALNDKFFCSNTTHHFVRNYALNYCLIISGGNLFIRPVISPYFLSKISNILSDSQEEIKEFVIRKVKYKFTLQHSVLKQKRDEL